MDIKKIGIIGAGTMGNGIAQAFAVCGYDVTMTDISEAAVQRGLKTVEGSLERLVKKEKMTADAKAAALGHIKTATDIGAVRGRLRIDHASLAAVNPRIVTCSVSRYGNGRAAAPASLPSGSVKR